MFAISMGRVMPVRAQSESYPFNFTHLTKDHGLPHNYCHTALCDRRGFLWFGTQDGLARYDGVRFKVYGYSEDATGLSAPTVLDLEEDEKGFLWIATVGGGLNRFDPLTETFTWYRNDPRNPASLPGNDLTNLLLDSDGSIWVGGLNCGLGRLDPRTGTCQNYPLATQLTTAEDQLLRNSVLDIAPDSEDPGILWLAANTGIYRFDKRSGQLDHFPAPTPCYDVLADTPGVVWVATAGGGIARVDKKTRQWTFFPPLPEAWRQQNLTNNTIADISRKSDRELWVASLDLGFGIFNLIEQKYTFFNTQSKRLAGQSSASANGLYRDPNGLLWVFNHKNGISLLDPASNVFDYTPLPADGCQNPALNEPQDFAWNEQRRELYVATRGCQGLYVYHPVQRVAPVELSGQSPYQLRYTVPLPDRQPAVLQCLLIDRAGRIWVGAHPEGAGVSLYEYLPEQRRLLPFRTEGTLAAQLQRYPVNALAEDPEGNLWAGTTRGGLFRISADLRRVEQFQQGDTFDGARTQITDLFCLPASSGGNAPEIWFSTMEAGVYRFSPAQQRFGHYENRPGAAKGLVENQITALEMGPDQTIWAATASQGLHKIPLGAAPGDEFRRYTVKDGLVFNSIHQLACSPDGQLWISTEKGISAFQPRTGAFETFDESDGLADTYLRGKGFRWCANGEIFVGQARGFYSFRPNAIYLNKTPPRLAFTGFELFGKPYSTGADLNFQPEVRLEHDQNFFTIQFAALSFSQSNRNAYRYRLDEIDPDWVRSGNRAEASYTGVPPGKYRFRVRAQNNVGLESADELIMTIVVAPAFYQTWWFRILVLVALFAGIAAYFRTRLERILKQETAKQELSNLRAVKAELENQALRSQMNPHFIFNALNTIEALIVEEKPDAASALLQKFSKLVRLVLENSRQSKVALMHELVALELYIQLEAVRLDNRFQYAIEIDPKIPQQRSMVPPMLLQPYVENAILHGLRHLQDREGLLTVQLDLLQEDKVAVPQLRCRIEDNGIGRARAAEINAKNRIGSKKQSLGTRITAERIDLLNVAGREDYTVEIVDISGENRSGTRVTLILPLEIRE